MKNSIFKRLFAVAMLGALITAGVYGGTRAVLSAGGDGKPTVIIDAGHGLPDGGAVSPDGDTVESTVNLRLARLINKKLCDAGFNCVMTRDSEDGIYSGGDTIHAKKVSDTRRRVEIAKNLPGALVLSVHMNTFPSPDVHGIQFFFNDGAKSVADELQNAVNIKYQNDNPKKAKPIPSNVYLFKHITNPSVLAECGFLTNANDLARLNDEEFLKSLAATVSEVVAYKLIGSEINAG